MIKIPKNYTDAIEEKNTKLHTTFEILIFPKVIVSMKSIFGAFVFFFLLQKPMKILFSRPPHGGRYVKFRPLGSCFIPPI